MTIYELKGTVLDLLYQLESGDTVYSEDGLRDTLEMIEGEFDDKVDSYCMVIQELSADAEKLKAEEARLAERRKGIERNIMRLKDVITSEAAAIGRKNVKTEHFTVNRFNMAKLDIYGSVPDEFKVEKTRTVKEPDRDAIKTALDAGEKLGFARYLASCTIK